MALTASAQQGSRRTVIMVLVIGMHFVGLYALQQGLARRLVELLPSDIQTKIIEEKKAEEPPPPPPPPPDMAPPPPPFVPPPEVSVSVPVESSTAIQTVTTERPVAPPPPVQAPVQQDVVVAPKIDPKRRPGSIEDYYPASAKRDNQEGSVIVNLYIGVDGKVSDAKVETSSGFPALDDGAIKYAKTWKLLPGTHNGVATPMWYKVKLTFKLTR